jgi:hypothetical protein
MLVVELERRVEICEVFCGAAEESGDTGWWRRWRGEWRYMRLVVELERRVETEEAGC